MVFVEVVQVIARICRNISPNFLHFVNLKSNKKYGILINRKDKNELISYKYAVDGAYVSTSRRKARYEYLRSFSPVDTLFKMNKLEYLI